MTEEMRHVVNWLICINQQYNKITKKLNNKKKHKSFLLGPNFY